MKGGIAGPRLAVGRVELCLPLHRVQVRNLDRVPGIAQALQCEVADRAVQRGGLRMGVDEKYVHDDDCFQ
ncbi:hypothetical protein D3C72_1977710 [compost metagenome]